MNENNLNGINPESTVPTPPVTPEAPVAPAEPVVPVAPVEQTVAPAAPVAPTPVVPAEPVVPAQPAAPVAPAAPVIPEAPVAPQVQAINPGQVPLTNPAPQAPKNNNSIFVVAVVVLVLAIGGLGAYLIFNNSGKKLDNNTTTTASQTSEVKGVEETTTQSISTTTKQITTNPYTTTQPRTTRSVDEPTPTKTDSTSIKVYNYNISLPGYEYYEKEGFPIAVNQSTKTQLTFNPLNIKYEDYFSDENLDQLAEKLQEAGFDVEDSANGYIGTRHWAILYLTSSTIPSGYYYMFMVTELDANTTVEITAYYNKNSNTADNIITSLTTALDNKTQAFASSDAKAGTKKDFSNFDRLDERLFN